jgi:hypothetical protein
MWGTMLKIVSAVGFCCLAQAYGAALPAGTDIQIRLKSKVATDTSKPKDPIEAVVIAPVVLEGRIAIPAGSFVRGSVVSVHHSTKPSEHSTLELDFTQVHRPSDRPVKIEARVADVDNARESVTSDGVVQGPASRLPLEGLRSRLHLPGTAPSWVKSWDGTISFQPGVEMTIKLKKPIQIGTLGSAAARVEAIRREPELSVVVNGEPLRARAEKPSKPSDFTNLMFLGSKAQIEQAFQDAGWASAARKNAVSEMETFLALTEMKGYNEAPVSTLLLVGQPPDLVFEKTNNTFAQRHHLRVWRRLETFEGMAIWVGAGTHDIGISPSRRNRTFIHKIDSNIDRERSKVVDDLIFAGRVKAMALIGRQAVPNQSENATGDKIVTDGKMAVLELK